MQNSEKEIRVIIKNYRESGLEHGGVKKRVFGKHKIVNGQVELDTTFYLYNSLLNEEGKIPFQFTKNTKQVFVCAHDLTSLWELPRECTCKGAIGNINDALIFNRNHEKIKTLEGITPIIYGGLVFFNQVDINLTNIHKHIKLLQGQISLNYKYRGPLLGTLLTNGLTRIGYYRYGNSKKDDIEYFNRLTTIVNNHLQTNRDILECQEELITNGYKDYAKL
jgi:hypothetical protein